MPMIDKPVEELLKYNGSTPCPEDFDEFWDARLSELDKINPDVKLVESDFKSSVAECFDLYYTGTKGARIYAKYLRPKNIVSNAPAILCFHGYSGSSGEWSEYLKYVSEGFCVAAMDCRGQGGKSQDVGGTVGTTFRGQFIRGVDGPPEDMLFVQMFLDTAILAKVVSSFSEVDGEKLCAVGGSQGGGLTLVCVSLVPEVKRAVSRFPFLSDYKRVWDMDLAKGAYEEIEKYFRCFDPRHEREYEIFEKLGYIDIQNMTKRIRAKVLMFTGLMDTTCPPSTQFAAYNKIQSEKEYILYPDFGHEGLKGAGDIEFTFLREIFED